MTSHVRKNQQFLSEKNHSRDGFDGDLVTIKNRNESYLPLRRWTVFEDVTPQDEDYLMPIETVRQLIVESDILIQFQEASH